ncbi:MAG: DUF4832 domain-containing protein [Marinoscillum sp.]
MPSFPYYVLAALICFAPSISITNAQSLEQKSYSSLDENFANPERGLYHHTEVHSGNYNLLSEGQLRSYRTNESITQILRVFYLENFRASPISQNYLDNMRRDFRRIRNAGIKCIVRFAYTTSSSAPYGDATPDVVQMHINQLTPIIRENADVIAVMQAGFIGAWGEWYYTDHFAGYTPGAVSQENWADRRAVVNSILKALPADRMVQIRTPGYKMKLYDSEEPLTLATAFSGENISRVGHHNDCFVASSSDYGTYVNPDLEKPFLEMETKYTPMGGETCNLAPPYSDCDNSLSELERFHWSYLNIDYNKNVLNEWEDQGCFDEVALNLGYRHQLLSSEYHTTSQPGGTFKLGIKLINTGYANFYNPRKLFVELVHNESGKTHHLQWDTNTRLWPIGEAHTLTLEAGIPNDISEGDYSVMLSLPDPYHTLNSPAYAARLANQDVWTEDLGFNDLGYDINISSTNDGPLYTGEQYFISAELDQTLLLEGSGVFKAKSGENAIQLYWPSQSGEYQRIIERSDESGVFNPIAALSAETSNFKDINVSQDISYSYRYLLQRDNSVTTYSDTLSNSLANQTFENITLDGADEDWGSLAPIGTSYVDNLASLRVDFDTEYLYTVLENASSYEIYLNADNNTQTGIQSASHKGADYKIAGENLHSFEGEAWVVTKSLEYSGNDEIAEMAIALTDIPLSFGSNTLHFSGEINGQELIHNNNNQLSVVRLLPPDAPDSIVVSKDEFTNNSLVINWKECFYCDGYLVERSTSMDSGFELIKSYSRDKTQLRDFNLASGVVHYYRIAAYNDLGTSTYSEIVSGTPERLIITSESNKALATYPNPTKNLLYLSKTAKDIQIFTLDGKTILSKKNADFINVQDLADGTYVLQIITQGRQFQQIIIKQ